MSCLGVVLGCDKYPCQITFVQLIWFLFSYLRYFMMNSNIMLVSRATLCEWYTSKKITLTSKGREPFILAEMESFTNLCLHKDQWSSLYLYTTNNCCSLHTSLINHNDLFPGLEFREIASLSSRNSNICMDRPLLKSKELSYWRPLAVHYSLKCINAIQHQKELRLRIWNKIIKVTRGKCSYGNTRDVFTRGKH